MDKAIAFVLGAAAGSLVTWKLIENKYKQIADEEIKSVVEHYKNKDKKESDNEQDNDMKLVSHYVEHDELDGTTTEYTQMVGDLGYSYEEDAVYIEPGVDYIAPYIISPEEYCDREGYDNKTWFYYTDFVLADEDGEIITDSDSIIGNAALNHFGEYADDAVYVRNDNIECDFEILKTEQTFSEYNGRMTDAT